MLKVKVHGLSDLAAALKALPPELASVRGGPLARALRKSANVIRDDARQRAPKKTGRLAKNIVTKRDPRPGNVTERQVVMVRRGRRKDDAKGAYYFHHVEFGTVKQEAQPFLRPAFDGQARYAVEVFVDEFAKEIGKAAAKVARG